MDHQQEQLESIKAIRNMMERSSRFLSLSGFSGAIVGILAIVGVIIAYNFLGMSFDQPGYYNKLVKADGSLNGPVFQFLFSELILLLATNSSSSDCPAFPHPIKAVFIEKSYCQL
jgi:hypothetical protein